MSEVRSTGTLLVKDEMRHPFLDSDRIENKRRGQLSKRLQFKVLKISTILFEKLVETVGNCSNKKKPRQFFLKLKCEFNIF